MSFVLRKRGRFWHFRGTVPMRQADGKISRIRIEESTRETSKTRASRVAQDRAQYYHEQAYRPKPKSISFTDAAITYVETKNPSKRDRDFAAKLVAHFGETPISEIDQAAVSDAAHKLYPQCSPSTFNRAVYAPVTTILRLSGGNPRFSRPSGRRKRQLTVPSDVWFDAVLPHCSPRLGALLVFITLTGRRITEALEAIDNGDGTATIGRTKTGNPVVVAVPRIVDELLERSGKRKVLERLFSYGDRHNVYRKLRRVCDRAGLPYYGTHALGRHSAARRLLREGHSTKFVAQALGWASTRMVDAHYGEFARDEVAERMVKSWENWGSRFGKKPENG